MPDRRDAFIWVNSLIYCKSKGWAHYLFIGWLQVFLCEKLALINEMYFAIALDRASAGPVNSSHPVFMLTEIVVEIAFVWSTPPGWDTKLSRYMGRNTVQNDQHLLAWQVIIACAKGGTSIEDLAEKYPDMIIKVMYHLLSVQQFNIPLQLWMQFFLPSICGAL